jgi:type II secretory pathway component PulF
MAKEERTFAPVHVAMVRAGERGAFLEPVLARLATLLEQQADLRARVVGNLLYPAVLLLVGVGVVIASLIFFVPKFEEFFSKMPDLPFATRLLLGASSVLTANAAISTAMIIGVGIAAFLTLRNARVRMSLLKRGEPLSAPLSASGLFADDVIEMIAVGESANNLPSVLVRLADTLESRIDRMLAMLLRLMEPAMLLVIAGVVMFIFLALVVPMMQLSSQL